MNEKEVKDSLRQEYDPEHHNFRIQPEPDVAQTGSAMAPPDGGWGWVVCFACFLTHVLTDGTFYSFGIIFIELLDFYQEDKGSTAVIASLSFGVCLVSGPLNAALTNYFGFRKTTIFGTILMTISLICSIFSPSVFYLYITFGISGIDSYQSAGLISSIGISNTIGRIIFGFISDLKCINRLWLYNIALVICGAGTLVCPFLDTFGALLTYTVIFGLFSGVTISLTSVIVADLVGTDLLADAFGVMNFFAGIFTFLGPPIAGWLYDITRSYDLPFLAAGIAITLSGAMLFVLPFITKKQPIKGS